jgi:hypothetical protein
MEENNGWNLLSMPFGRTLIFTPFVSECGILKSALAKLLLLISGFLNKKDLARGLQFQGNRTGPK